MCGKAARRAFRLRRRFRLHRNALRAARRRRAALRAEAAVCGGWPRKGPELAGTSAWIFST